MGRCGYGGKSKGKTKNQGMGVRTPSKSIGKDFTYNGFPHFSHAKNGILDMNEPALKTAYRKQEDLP